MDCKNTKTLADSSQLYENMLSTYYNGGHTSSRSLMDVGTFRLRLKLKKAILLKQQALLLSPESDCSFPSAVCFSVIHVISDEILKPATKEEHSFQNWLFVSDRNFKTLFEAHVKEWETNDPSIFTWLLFSQKTHPADSEWLSGCVWLWFLPLFRFQVPSSFILIWKLWRLQAKRTEKVYRISAVDWNETLVQSEYNLPSTIHW